MLFCTQSASKSFEYLLYGGGGVNGIDEEDEEDEEVGGDEDEGEAVEDEDVFSLTS
jgi:hypothetical protein